MQDRGDHPGLTGREVGLDRADQLLDRPGDLGHRVVQVELDDLGARTLARGGDVDADGRRFHVDVEVEPDVRGLAEEAGEQPLAPLPFVQAQLPPISGTPALDFPDVERGRLSNGIEVMKATPPSASGSLGSPTPSMPTIASRTPAPWSALATTWTVLEASARPCSSSICCPVIDSNSCV